MKLETQLAGVVRSLDLADLPKCRFSERSFPSVAVVYFIFSKDRLLYIGESVNLSHRFRSRSSHQIWYYVPRLQDADIAYLETPNRDERLLLERLAIVYFKPKWNTETRNKANGPITQRMRKLLAGDFCTTCGSALGGVS